MPSINHPFRSRSLLALAATLTLAATANLAQAQRGGIALETLRADCVNAATSQGYSVIGRSQETRSGNAYSAILQLRGNGRVADYTCTTNGRATQIPGITDVRLGDNVGTPGQTRRRWERNRTLAAEEMQVQRDRARQMCTESIASYGRGGRNVTASEPTRRSDGQWDVAFQGPGNGNGRGNGRNAASRSCRYDPQSDRARIY